MFTCATPSTRAHGPSARHASVAMTGRVTCLGTCVISEAIPPPPSHAKHHITPAESTLGEHHRLVNGDKYETRKFSAPPRNFETRRKPPNLVEIFDLRRSSQIPEKISRNSHLGQDVTTSTKYYARSNARWWAQAATTYCGLRYEVPKTFKS